MVGCSKERWKSDVGNVLFIYLLFNLHSTPLYYIPLFIMQTQ
jgi:hypothetical protein